MSYEYHKIDSIMQKTIICYNENEVIEKKEFSEEMKMNHKIWIDIVNPTSSEISNLGQRFNLEQKAVTKIEQKTKKPQVMIFNNHKFTVFLYLKFNTIKNLESHYIYFLSG